MSRVLVAAIGAVVVAMLGFAIFAITGPRPDPASLATADTPESPAAASDAAPPVAAVDTPPAEAPPAVPAVDVGENAAARATFEEWALPLRALGMEVAASGVGYDGQALHIAGLDVEGVTPLFAWHWSSGEARIKDANLPGFTLSANGAQALTLTRSGTTSSWAGTLGGMQIKVQSGATRPFTTLLVTLAGLDLRGEAGEAPITVAEADLRINLGTGSVPGTSLKLAGLALPAFGSGPLGGVLQSLEVEVDLANATAEGLPASNLALTWGALELTGRGRIGLDAVIRPTGSFEVEVPDPLAVLDAIHAVQRFDRTVMAEAYAVLLARMAEGEPIPLTLTLSDGGAELLGAGPDGGDLALDSLGPLFGAAP